MVKRIRTLALLVRYTHFHSTAILRYSDAMTT